MRIRARGLLARIVVSFFLLSAVIVVFLTALAHAAIVGGTRSAVIGQLDTLATTKEQALDTWIGESLKKVVHAAGEDTLAAAAQAARSDPQQTALRAHLRSLQQDWPELGDLMVATQPDGLVVAATTTGLDGQYRNRDSWFVFGRLGPYVQSVYPSPVLLRPTLTVSAPIRGRGGGLGVLAANLDLSVLDWIVADTRGPFHTTRTYLVDRFSSLVSSRRFGSEQHPRGVHSRGIDAAVAGQVGSATYVAHDGIPVVGVYRWLEENKLALVVEVPVSEAYRATRRLTVLIATTGILVVAVLAAGVLILARTLRGDMETYLPFLWR